MRGFFVDSRRCGSVPSKEENEYSRGKNTFHELWSNVALSPRLEGVEVFHSTRAAVYPRHCPQPDAVDPPGVVIHRSRVGFLNAVYPQRQTPIVRAPGRRRAPV